MADSKKYEKQEPYNRAGEKKKQKNYNTIKGKIENPEDLYDDDEDGFEKFTRKK